MSLQLRVLVVGRRRDAQLGPLIDEYITRSKALLPVSFLAFRDETSMLKAAGRLHVVLDERGEQWTSERLAAWLAARRDEGVSAIDFLVGGADGFDDRTRQQASLVLGLSRLTLPHRLAQLVLVEQLYRAGSILASHPYHRS